MRNVFSGGLAERRAERVRKRSERKARNLPVDEKREGLKEWFATLTTREMGAVRTAWEQATNR